MSRGRRRKFIQGVGWVRPKRGYVWTTRGDKVRPTMDRMPAWGSRKFGVSSIAEDWYSLFNC